jgi:transposase-like protein
MISDEIGWHGMAEPQPKGYLSFQDTLRLLRQSPRKLMKIVENTMAEVAYQLKEALEDENKMYLLSDIFNQKDFSKSADTIENFWFDLWNYKAYPRQRWRRIRTTNGIERTLLLLLTPRRSNLLF